MANEGDTGNDTAEILNNSAIRTALPLYDPENPLVIETKNPSGECLWCDEHTGTERRFCDKECADEWDVS